jgi:hypothetical protein
MNGDSTGSAGSMRHWRHIAMSTLTFGGYAAGLVYMQSNR